MEISNKNFKESSKVEKKINLYYMVKFILFFITFLSIPVMFFTIPIVIIKIDILYVGLIFVFYILLFISKFFINKKIEKLEERRNIILTKEYEKTGEVLKQILKYRDFY